MKCALAIAILLSIFVLSVMTQAAPTTGKSPTTSPTTKPAKPKLTYKLGKGSEDWDAKMKQKVVDAMEAAVAIYNANGDFEKTLTVYYNPGTPTADGNYNGTIRFGGQIGTRTALHEIAHTLGIGQHPKWNDFIKDGKWTGEYALKQLREFDGPDAVLHADRQHFWPYGLNYDGDGVSDENFRRNTRMVAAFRRDLGITK
jgi:hypothetical protein